MSFFGPPEPPNKHLQRSFKLSHSFGLFTAGLDERAEDAAGDGSVIARSEKGKGVQANEEHVRASTADAGRGR